MSHPAPRHLVAEGFVLAGGASSRLGSDKSLVLLAQQPDDSDQQPLIARAVHLLRSVGLSVRIAGARDAASSAAFAAFAPVLPDEYPGLGPLSGVQAALLASRAEFNLFVPVDMPLVPHVLLAYLLRRAAITRAPVTCLRAGGLLLPFPVVLHRSVLPAVRKALAHDASCFRLWQSFPAFDAPRLESLLQSGQIPSDALAPALWLQSVNTQADLMRLRHCFALRAQYRTLKA